MKEGVEVERILYTLRCYSLPMLSGHFDQLGNFKNNLNLSVPGALTCKDAEMPTAQKTEVKSKEKSVDPAERRSDGLS